MNNDKKQTLKAYSVADFDNNTSTVIVWAESAGKAKSACVDRDEFDGYDFTDIRVHCTPEFDKYADTKRVPIEDLLKCSWWFNCETCGDCIDDIDEDSIKDGKAFITHRANMSDFIDGSVICASCKEGFEAKGIKWK